MKIISKNQILFYKNDDVIRFEASAGNAIIHFLNGTSAEINEPIQSIEKQLTDLDFIRVHEDHIINVNYITKIADDFSDSIELENGVILPVNKKTKEMIINLLNNHISQ